MRILITGGAGFIGSHSADLLADQGHSVLLLDAFLPQAHGSGATPEWVQDHDLVRGDVRDGSLLRGLLSNVDAVCHQAAMVGHGLDPSDAPDYTANNDLGTAVLLAAMHATGVRQLVLASSMVVYGEGRYACPADGVVPAAPRPAADLAAGRYEVPCPRCGTELEPLLVGEDAPLDPRSTYAGVASIFRSALERGVAPQVMEDGRQRRDFVHVSDIAQANTLALTTEPPFGRCEPVNVCSGHPHTVGELAAELARAMKGPAPQIIGGARPGDVRHVTADPARAAELLGYRARVGFAEGVARFATDPLREPVTTS